MFNPFYFPGIRKSIKWHLLTIIFIFSSATMPLDAQIILRGELVTDTDKPVPDTRMSIAGGPSGITNSNGKFQFRLSRLFIEGERVIILVFKDGWVINHPLDGEWNLPNIKYQDVHTTKVIIVPHGSMALWTHDRIEKHIAKLSDELTKTLKTSNQSQTVASSYYIKEWLEKYGFTPDQLKKQFDELAKKLNTNQDPQPVDFDYYLKEWADKYGFTPDQVKKQFDEWAEATEGSNNFRTLGAREFYLKNFTKAAIHFEKAAQQDEAKIKSIKTKLQIYTLSAYENWKNAAESLYVTYKFRESLEKLQRAEAIINQKTFPLQYAEIQILIGNCKHSLASRVVKGEEVKTLLSSALKSYQKALLIYTSKDSPLQWAVAQNHLGNVLKSQGTHNKEEGINLLTQAEEVFQSVLEVISRKDFPQQWSMTQNHLGNTLHEKGKRIGGSNGVKLLSQAKQCLRNALGIITQENFPQQWAAILNNLGNLLKEIAKHIDGEEGTRLLTQAEQTFRKALKVYSRKDFPLQWSMTQNHLGNVLSDIGIRTGGEKGIILLQEAVTAYRNSLKVLNRKDFPQKWASAQGNLGVSLKDIGIRIGGKEQIQFLIHAEQAFRKALDVYTREDFPLNWANTQTNLGTVLKDHGILIRGAKGMKLLTQAEQAFRWALAIHTKDSFPLVWAGTQNNLGNTLREIGALTHGEKGDSFLPQAVEAYQNTFEVYTRKYFPLQWAKTQDNLGIARHYQGIRTTGKKKEILFAQAEKAFQNALEIRNAEYLAGVWARTQKNLAHLYEDYEDWPAAIKCYQNAFKVDPSYAAYRLGYLYHNKVFLFEKSLEMNLYLIKRGFYIQPVTLKLMENYFTAGRFKKGIQHMEMIMDVVKTHPDVLIFLTLFKTANFIGLNDTGKAADQFDTLIHMIESQPPFYKLNWDFTGTKYFIKTNKNLVPHRKWLLAFFTALEKKGRDKILTELKKLRRAHPLQ